VKRLDTARCLSSAAWAWKPKSVSPASTTFTVTFEGEVGVVPPNATHPGGYNELLFSTGRGWTVPIRELEVNFRLPGPFSASEVSLVGTHPGDAVLDLADQQVSFTRAHYLAPSVRYAVGIRYPLQPFATDCKPCSKVPDWAMYLILSPFLLCFIIPCVMGVWARNGSDNLAAGGPGGEGR
jgi:hypothetical protein